MPCGPGKDSSLGASVAVRYSLASQQGLGPEWGHLFRKKGPIVFLQELNLVFYSIFLCVMFYKKDHDINREGDCVSSKTPPS